MIALNKSSLFVIAVAIFPCAHAYSEEYKCPPKSGPVASIEYSNDMYYPIFTIKGYPGYKVKLSPKYGVDKVGGRVMVSILLTAYATGREVKIDEYCNNGEMNKIIINNLPFYSADDN